MQYQYCPHNPARYATNLLRERGSSRLYWENADGQDVLLVQTPFGVPAAERMEALCQAMGKTLIQPGRYTEVLPGVWVRFVSAMDKVQMNGCPINTEASTYTVFSCLTEGEVCSIFAPQPCQAMISADCSIPMRIRVEVTEQFRRRRQGLFGHVMEPTGFYTLSFPRELAGTYQEGGLFYRAGGLEIPVTRQMLEQGVVYVKTDIRPELVSRNKGLELI
ncbi:MAG: hypothetical protein HFG00_02770 [Oscillibacter sp.]|nr:hypothetical protein [Oscillibacter sp.]